MNLQRDQARLRQRYDANSFQLIATELDLAITFCQVATTTNDVARYDRNISNAQQAYATAVHFLGCNHLKTNLHLEIKEKLSLLSSMLSMAATYDAEQRAPRVMAFPFSIRTAIWTASSQT